MEAGAEELRQLTELLADAHAGEPGALDRVVAVAYPGLLRLARTQLRRFDPGTGTPTLEPDALVNETYLKLIRQRARYDSRGHFFAIASKLMLRTLLDHERTKGRDKRGGGLHRVSLTEAAELAVDPADASVEAFSLVLADLERLDARAADIVKARVLWGMTIPEIAASFEVSTRTVERSWAFAQRWLETELVRQAGSR
jgi:RNA polymerase sigma factor (TIGR02999 family)